ncbi:MAG: hypothetical protein ABII00_13795 [Elusimicrobiota bacterium]
MPENPLVILALSAVGAAAIGGSLYKSGNREAGTWAVPVGAAVLIGGAGYALYLPNWLVVGVFLTVLFLFHRTVRGRLLRAARGIGEVAVPELELVLRRLPEPEGKKAVAVWSSGEGPEPLDMSLDFVGEAEDEYSVILSAEAPRFRPGVLVIHDRRASGECLRVLREREPVVDLKGQAADMVVRSLPVDYAFGVLDLRTLAALQDIFELRTEKRELYVHVSGRYMRVISSAIFREDELRTLVARAAVVFERVRSFGRATSETA